MDTKISDDENFINFSDPPTLQSIATASVALQLWRNVDLKMCRKHYDYDWAGYEKLEKLVIRKLMKVPLPNSLKMAVSDITRHIGVQWLKWINSRDFEDYFDHNELHRTVGISHYWTMYGTFDKVQLLKEVIRSTVSQNSTEKDFVFLYKLACNYCLDERTISDLRLKLWNITTLAHTYVDCEDHIVAYWTSCIENNLSNLLPALISTDYRNIYDCNLNINVNMVSSTVFLGNSVALKYFWHKLSAGEINSNLGKWLEVTIGRCKLRNRFVYGSFHDKLGRILSNFKDFHAHTDVLCFLLSKMNSEEQKEAFQAYSEIILDSLLFHWPLQRFLIPTIASVVDYLQDEEYVQLLSKLTYLINEKVATCSQLREIWCLSPLKLRKSFLSFLVRDAAAIVRLLKVGDKMTIDLILENGSPEEQKRIIFRMIKENIFYSLMWSDEFDISMIDSLATKLLSSDSDIISFKRSVTLEHAVTLVYRQNFEAADKLLNWAFHSPKEIEKFKRKHINPRIACGVIKYAGSREYVTNFLNWYFDTEEEIYQFKNNCFPL